MKEKSFKKKNNENFPELQDGLLSLQGFRNNVESDNSYAVWKRKKK